MTSESALIGDKIAKKQLCLFCYKVVVSESNKRTKEAVNNDIRNFSKYLGEYIGLQEQGMQLPWETSSGRLTLSSKPDNDFWEGLGRCRDCEIVVKSFCALYHEWKCLELQLEWKVKMLIDIMKSANRVTSRVQQLNNMFQETNETNLEEFKKCRRILTRKCDEKISKSMPRVMLKRFGENSVSKKVPSSSRIKYELVHNDNDYSTAFADNVGVAVFLGWSMSMAAVVLLVAATNDVSSMGYGELNVIDDWHSDGHEEMEEREHVNVIIPHQLSTSSVAPVENQVSSRENYGLSFDATAGEKQEIRQHDDERFIKHEESLGRLNIIGEQETGISPENSSPTPMDQDIVGESTVLEMERNEDSNVDVDSIHQSSIISLENVINDENENHATTNRQCKYENCVVSAEQEENYHCHGSPISGSSVVATNENMNKTELVHDEEELHQDEYTSSSSSEDEAEQKIEIKSHITTTNTRQQLQSVGKRLFQCKICFIMLKRQDILQRHVLEQHSNPCSTEIPSSSQNTEGIPKLRYFRCKTCNVSFKRYSVLRRHKTSKSHKARRKLLLTRQRPGTNIFTKSIAKQIPESSSKQEAPICTANADMIEPLDQISCPVNPQVQQQEHVILIEKIKEPTREQTVSEKNDETTLLPQARYSLRGNRKKSYHDMVLNDADDEDKNSDVNFELDDHHNSSEDDFDEHGFSEPYQDASCSNSSETTDTDANPGEVTISNASEEKYIYCNLDWCLMVKVDKGKYRNHQTLHGPPGRYECNFCKTIEENVAKLSEHERTTHLSENGNTSRGATLRCPRCSFRTRTPIQYLWHFAEVHVGGFERNRVSCFICGMRLPKTGQQKSQEKHFKTYHDTLGMEPEEIQKCNSEGCTAYFKTARQLYLHQYRMHEKFAVKKEVEPKKDKKMKRMKKIKEAKKNNENKKKRNTRKKLTPRRAKRTFTCKYCKKVFKKSGSLFVHKQNFHKSSNEFVCQNDNCQYRFKTVKDLETHQKLHGKFYCNFCDVTKNFAPDLSLHEMEHAIRPDPITKHSEKSTTASQTFNCPRCPYSCDRESVYIRHHLKSHISLTSALYTCSICSAEGVSHKFLDTHFKNQHKTDGLDASQIWRCDKCPAYFIKSNQLNPHKMRVHNNGSNTCPECSKTYKSGLCLRSHMELMHPTSMFNSVFPCDLATCKRRFSSQKRLDQHMLIVHNNKSSSGEGKVKCSKCDKEFDGEQKLKFHMSAVHVARSFVCSECGKAFKAKASLAIHMDFHKPESWRFQCATCGKKLYSQQKLDEHTRTHTKEKPFVCQFCGEKYAHRHNWRNHVKSKHPDESIGLEHSTSNRAIKEKGNYLSRKGSKKGDIITAGTKA